jgi:hypothetical protein
MWITPSSSAFAKLPPPTSEEGFFPIICVSASKQVHDGVERRSGGFSYIQGSADDHELWGMVFTFFPSGLHGIFTRHRLTGFDSCTLLATPRQTPQSQPLGASCPSLHSSGYPRYSPHQLHYDARSDFECCRTHPFMLNP